MRYHLIKNKLLSSLLVFALLFTLLPATAWAAAATGTASGTAGYNNIAVSLSGASQFSADTTAVENTSNWEIIPTDGTQTILGITKHTSQYVSIVLSAPIQAGQTFTIDAATEVFEPGTDMFLAPLDVNITVPTPATGTAAASAGTKEIAVTLTRGTFGSKNAVETPSLWTLGGASASENPIESVTYLDSTHATVTLTNNIGASDTYTITAAQPVFVNAAIAPFVSPLSVTVESAAEPLTLIGAAVTAEGGVGLTFNKELSPTDLVNKVKEGFTVEGLLTPKPITNATLHSNAGGTNNFIQLYLDPTVKGGEAVSLSYTPGTVQSLDGGMLAAISSMDITNGLLHPELITSAPPAATVGAPYAHTLTASGGTGPYTFSIAVDGGSLPSGLTMSNAGVISGTPTVAANFTFFVMVQDANQAIDIEGFSITVNAPSAKVCEIGGMQYATLDAALADVPTNGTDPTAITLLTDVTDNDGISISRKKVTLNLNGKTLTVNNPSGTSGPNSGNGIHLQLLSELNVTGPGILNVDAQMAGLSMNESKFIASENVTVEINSDTNLGLYTDTACTVNLHGNVSGAAGGIYAAADNTITVSGTVAATGSGTGNAVHLNNTGNTVQVGSAIVSSGTGNGVYISESSGGTVTVGSVGAPGQIVGKGHGISVRMGITPAIVTVYGDVEGASHGISASDDSTITVYGNVKSTAVASDRYGIYCAANSDPSNIIINGNVEGVNGVYIHGAQSELTVNGNVTAKGLDPVINVGARASYAKLHVTGSITANSCIGAYSFESSEIVIDGTVTAAKYIKVKYADKTITDIDAVSSKADYRQYSSADAFVWVKSAIPSDKVCEIGGTQYATLDAALATINDGETKTIKLLSNVTHNKGIVLSGGQQITFDLNGYSLQVDGRTPADSSDIGEGVLVTNGRITYIGSGSFSVIGDRQGVRASGASSFVTVGSAEASAKDGAGAVAMSGGSVVVNGSAIGGAFGAAAGENGSTVVVNGDAIGTTDSGGGGVSAGSGTTVTVTGKAQGVMYGAYANGSGAEINISGDAIGTGIYSHGVHAEGGGSIHVTGNVEGTQYGVVVSGASSSALIGGNVTVTATVNGWGINVERDGVVEIGGNVMASGQSLGVFATAGGKATIDGAIQALPAKYIHILDTTIGLVEFDGSPESRTASPVKEGYYTYSADTSVVWVKSTISSANVCEIGGTQYATLDAALATINDGEIKTITLLKNIDYDKGITLINKKITFALNGYTLNVVNTVEHGYALAVANGGCVYLSGTGALNVTGPARGYGVTVASNGASSEVTVTNATGIGTESKAAHAYNHASLTVLGDVTATGIGSYGVHAQAGALVEVQGNVSAGNQGVCVSDAAARVTGSVQSTGNDSIGNPEGIGVNVYDGVAEIGGDVTASRVGAMITAGGSITINGMLTAPDYIQFADDAPTAIDGYLETTTQTGYRTYQHATAGTVWILGDLPINTYALIVTNGTGSYSYAKDTVITITANTAPSGQRFKEWSITPSVTFADSTNKNNQTAKIIMPAQPVAAVAIYEVLPASEYAITVQNDGNGTASANFNSAAEGAEITLTATPNSGYRFKEWQVISGGVTVVNNKFSVLDTNVTVKAIFEPVPAASFNVVVNGSYAGVSGAGSYAKDTTVTVHAGSRSSYNFAGWTSSDGVAFANADSATTTFAMPAKNVVVTANWSYNGGGGAPSGGGGTTTPKYEASVTSGIGSVVTEVKVNTNNASAELTPAQAAKGMDISVTMPKIPDVKSYTLGIPVPSLSDANGNGSVTLNTGTGNITLPSNMLIGTDTASGSKAQISIGTVKPDDLPKDAQDKVGTRPIVSLSLSIDSKTVTWNNPNAPVTVSIPYTPTAEELKSPDRITVWYIDGSGNLVEMQNAKYDSATGTVVFQTTHFSFYAVGYKAPATSVKFTDVLPGAWYYDAVTFIAEKSITTGTGDGKFSPEAALTRGQFIVMLMKAYSIEAEKTPTDNFSDAGNTYYTNYLATAKAKGISSGIGDNKFGPEQAITRQEMFTLLYNALKLLNKLPAGDNGKTIVSFTDSGSVASWATEALTALVKSGTVSGSGNRLDPTATTTRAQMAQVLYNLLGK